MGFPICGSKCPICAVADMYCLAGNGDDDYSPATKEQVIKRLDEGSFNSKRDMMTKYLKREFNYDYDNPRKEANMSNYIMSKKPEELAYKITYGDLRNAIMQTMGSHDSKMSIEMPGLLNEDAEVEWEDNCIKITFTIPSDRPVKTTFFLSEDDVHRVNYEGEIYPINGMNITQQLKDNHTFSSWSVIQGLPVREMAVLLIIYQGSAMTNMVKMSSGIDVMLSKATHHVEIDEEEYAKHHTNKIKSLPVVNSLTDDKTLNTFIDLTSDDGYGLFTLELNATEADKKDEVLCATLASTTIRMTDYSDKKDFLNHIKNIIYAWPKATEEIFDKYYDEYYDSIPKEEDLTTKISNILREAGVDESKIPDTAIALIDTMIFPDDE